MPDPRPLAEMTDEELRREIAAVLGWTDVSLDLGLFTGVKRLTGIPPRDEGIREDVPQWPTSIAAAFALEETIPEDDRECYSYILMDILVTVRGMWPGPLHWCLTHATPRQRCEAFVAYRRAKGAGE